MSRQVVADERLRRLVRKNRLELAKMVVELQEKCDNQTFQLNRLNKLQDKSHCKDEIERLTKENGKLNDANCQLMADVERLTRVGRDLARNFEEMVRKYRNKVDAKNTYKMFALAAAEVICRIENRMSNPEPYFPEHEGLVAALDRFGHEDEEIPF